MVQELTTLPSAGTRFAQGVQQGLSNVLPKEFEHQRLKSGLQALAQKSKAGNLSPEEFLAEAAGTYGISPQAVQSFGKLASQQSQARSLSPGENVNEPKSNVFKTEERAASAKPTSKSPSTTRADLLKDIQEGFIEPDVNEIQRRATERFRKNPALHKNDFNNALAAEKEDVAQQRQAYNDKVELNKKHQAIHDNIINRLKTNTNKLNAQIPYNVYQDYENEAVKAVIPESLGGGGLTEDQAVDRISKKIDETSREYADVAALGGANMIFKDPKAVSNSMKGLVKKFKARDDQKNLAQTFISENGFSPPFAYSRAYPLEDTPELNNEIKNLPTIGVNLGFIDTLGKAITGIKDNEKKQKTLEVSEKLAHFLKKGGASPLAVYEALDSKGYDPEVWKEYLIDNQDKLDLTKSQIDEITKSRGGIQGFFNDLWIKVFGG